MHDIHVNKFISLVLSEIMDDTEDYDEDNEDDDDSQTLDFMEFIKIINRMFIERIKHILVTAGGGYGKTTASKRLAIHWSEGECLKSCLFFIRVDLKNIQKAVDLFSAFLEQFPEIPRSLTEEELQILKSVFKNNQGKVFFALDGLDESKSKKLAKSVFGPNRTDLPDSFVMLLSRPEAKKYLETSNADLTEFEITRLSKEQYQKFALNFPFTIGQREKGQQLIEKCNQNPSFGKLMEVPLTAVMNCTLFNDPKLSRNLSDELDLFYCLIALYIKFELLKQIEVAMEAARSRSDEEITKLQLKKDEILLYEVEDIFKAFKTQLEALGRAVYECNGNSIVGFKDCNKKEVEASLKSQNLDSKTTSFIVRLSFMEEIIDEDSIIPNSVLRFLHRDIREFVMSIFVAHNVAELPTQKEFGNLKDAHVSIFRCVIAMHVRSGSTPEQVHSSLKPLFEHLFSQNVASKWRVAQMMCELTQVYVKFDDENQRRVILELIKMLRTSMKENLPQLGKNWGRHYLECLITHFDHADCEICALSDSLREKSSFETSSEKRYINQWPQQHPFHIFPFLSQESETIRFTFRPQDF